MHVWINICVIFDLVFYQPLESTLQTVFLYNIPTKVWEWNWVEDTDIYFNLVMTFIKQVHILIFCGFIFQTFIFHYTQNPTISDTNWYGWRWNCEPHIYHWYHYFYTWICTKPQIPTPNFYISLYIYNFQEKFIISIMLKTSLEHQLCLVFV